ncbi:MAG: DegT/DnrJ/EryC1/StrS family aminotransferase [Anaerorhabdus sp.]|uniref:DegT/DnrJ/EryC1/StrS family aminotransferase n=1 Tax=Anaerorhabdus sp. TaxID=1872524 RepID=UPI002FC81F8B
MKKNGKKYLVVQSTLPSFDDFQEEIKSIWQTKWLTNMGEKHQLLQKKLEQFLDVNHVVMFTNGHLALESAIEALNLNGEVITTPFTFASTTHAIVRNGLIPVFCDIDENTCTIDVTKIERLITDKTCAILPVHVYGNICNVEEIERIATKYNLKVIYDAAHAFGVKYKNTCVGNFGDMSMFSFHATKVFNTIEGGAITFNRDEYEKILNNNKNFGILNQDEVVSIGGNAKMNEFQAAMGLCNLRNFELSINKRERAYNRYISNLSKINGIKLLMKQDDVSQNYAYMPIVLDGFSLTRDQLKDRLEEYDIFTRKYFYPLISDFECYRNEYNSTDTPIARRIAKNVLTLPLYEDLTEEDVDYICKVIEELGNE